MINKYINSLKIRLQYVLPKQLLTRLVGVLAGAKLGKATTWAIQRFAAIYHINTAEMAEDMESFATFNDFFARALKPDARPIDAAENSIVSPADGRISQYGTLLKNLQLQAKDHYFSVDSLLGDAQNAAAFTDGSFITVYLSPSDYHRVHMPFAGRLLQMTYIPGELFSVNPLYTQNIPELFARNERVVCLFDTALGKMAVVLVGAAIVRSITTVWAGVVAPNRSRQVTVFDYSDQDIRFNKGDEIGRFTMGSTVICLFGKNAVEFAADLALEQHVAVGQKIASGK